MKCLPELPPALTDVAIPATFAVSQLPAALHCRLRAVLGSSNTPAASLTAHPAAELGRIAHALMEQAVGRRIQPETGAREEFERLLEEHIGSAQTRLARDSRTAAFSNLPNTMTPLEWRRKKRQLVDQAVQLFEGRSSPSSGAGERSGEGSIALSELPPGRWAELRVESIAMRLRGRIDIVEKRQGRMRITDLKSGRIANEDGIRPDIELQLRLYGLMAMEEGNVGEIELVVSDGAKYSVDFNEPAIEDARRWLDAILSDLPAGARIPSSDLAAPGSACRLCSFRHVCTAYLAAAPQSWCSGTEEPLPLDTWGDVESMVKRDDGLINVTIRDAASRLVKVFAVRNHLLAGVKVGERLFFFGLQGRGRRSREGLWRHPLNFHDVAEDQTRQNAWLLQTYVVRRRA